LPLRVGGVSRHACLRRQGSMHGPAHAERMGSTPRAATRLIRWPRRVASLSQLARGLIMWRVACVLIVLVLVGCRSTESSREKSEQQPAPKPRFETNYHGGSG